VNTRLAKLDRGEYDAIILAAAGLRRLGMGDRIRGILPEGLSVPAIAQGILAIEYRDDREDLDEMLAGFEDAATDVAARAERALGLVVEGSCDVPLGGYARVSGSEVSLEGFIGSPDGANMVRQTLKGASAKPESVGHALGERLLAAGGRAILDAIPKRGP
jgi:hydroxymethylbilane synthase